MRIRYKYAVLSFCPDLTDPSAQSIPVGLIGIASAKSQDFVFFAGRNQPGDHFKTEGDEALVSILNNLHWLIHRQLTEKSNETSAENFFSWVQDHFRSTIHVSKIERADEEVASYTGFLSTLGRLCEKEKVRPGNKSGKKPVFSASGIGGTLIEPFPKPQPTSERELVSA